MVASFAQPEKNDRLDDPLLAAFYRACPGAKMPVPLTDRLPPFSITEIASQFAEASGFKLVSPYPQVPRIAVWGDSHTASADFMLAALKQWGFSKESIRPAWVQPAMQISGVRLPLKKSCVSAGWRVSYAHRNINSSILFSKSLLQITSDLPNEYVWLDFRFPNDDVRLRWVNVHYKKIDENRPLVVGITLDNGVERIMDVVDDDTVLHVRSSMPFATMKLRLISGQLAIHAFAPIYSETPEVLLDIFSTPGALAKGWSDVVSDGALDSSYDTVIFEYGTNEAMDPEYKEEVYLRSLRQSLTKFRKVNPKARCILVGPPERGNLGHNDNIPYGLVHQSINRVQSQVARDYSCVAWSWQAALGGQGSVKQLMAIFPPLIKKDQIHLTQEGYEISGRRFAKAINWQN